jgi:hypothetical protein
MQTMQTFIRSQGATCAVLNIVLNPAIAWLGNREMAFVPLTGGNGILVDTIVTSVVLSVLVSLFVSSATGRAISEGKIAADEVRVSLAPMLARMPDQPWANGLLIGVAAAFVLSILFYLVFRAFGWPGLPFAAFAFSKAAYTPILGYVVTTIAIRQRVAKARNQTI